MVAAGGTWETALRVAAYDGAVTASEPAPGVQAERIR